MSINSDLNRLLKVVEGQSNKSLNYYQRQIILNYKTALTEIKKTYALWLERGYGVANLQQLMENINGILRDAGIKGNNITTNSIKENFVINYDGVQDAFKTALNTSSGFSVLNPQTVNAAVINPYSNVNWQSKGISNTVQATSVIRSEITQGIIQGKGYGDVAKKITDQLNITTSDAIRIVRTETHRAANQARVISVEDSVQSAERLGFTPQTIWNCSNVNSRDSHLNLDGTAADDNGLWTFDSGVQTKGPGLSGDPGEDINCRCFITVEIKEL